MFPDSGGKPVVPGENVAINNKKLLNVFQILHPQNVVIMQVMLWLVDVKFDGVFHGRYFGSYI
jgi:hypothetical protein